MLALGSEMFDVDDFAQAITYTPTGKTAKVINAIFDGPPKDPALFTGTACDNMPRVLCQLADVSDATNNGATVQVGGVVYKAFKVEPDYGQQTTTIFLSRV